MTPRFYALKAGEVISITSWGEVWTGMVRRSIFVMISDAMTLWFERDPKNLISRVGSYM